MHLSDTVRTRYLHAAGRHLTRCRVVAGGRRCFSLGMQRVSQQKLGARKARREIRAAFSPHKSEPSGVGWVLKRALRRENDAGTGTSDGIPYETRPPEKKWRRSLGYRGGHVRKFPFGEKKTPEYWFPTDPVREAPSGEEMTPQRGSWTGFRTRWALRRRILAGSPIACAAAAETSPPAPKWRRNPGSRRDPVRDAPSGVEMTPEGGL